MHEQEPDGDLATTGHFVCQQVLRKANAVQKGDPLEDHTQGTRDTYVQAASSCCATVAENKHRCSTASNTRTQCAQRGVQVS